MKLHFANSAFINTPERAVLRGGRWRKKLRLRVRYGILENPRFGPVLIDTGYSADVADAPHRSFALRTYSSALKPRLLKDGDLGAVLARLGYKHADISRIVITHFHADHVSALRNFPKADVIAHGAALTDILGRGHFANLRHGIFTELLPENLPDRIIDVATLPKISAPLNLGVGQDLFGDGQVIAIDLPGHAAGHLGLCFPEIDPVMLYACDVQWINRALSVPQTPPLLSRFVSDDWRAARRSSIRVAEFSEAGGRVVLCHDPDLSPYDLDQAEDV